MSGHIMESSGDEETHSAKSSPSKLSHSMARFLGLESTESPNAKSHKVLESPNRFAASTPVSPVSASTLSRNPRPATPSTSSQAPSSSLSALPSSPTTPPSMRRGSRRKPDDERRGSNLFGFGRPKSATSTPPRTVSLAGSPSARPHLALRADGDDEPVLTIRRSEPLNQGVSGLGVGDVFSARESQVEIPEAEESDDEDASMEDDSDDELDPRPKYCPRQGKAYALLGLPSPPTLAPSPSIRRSPSIAFSPPMPPRPAPLDQIVPAFPCTQTDLAKFIHTSAEIRVYAHITTAFRRSKWRPRWIILTLSPKTSTATLHSFKNRLGTSAKDEVETGRLELVGNTEIYVPVEQLGEKYVLNVTGTTSIMEGTRRLDVMSNILLSFADIEAFKFWMTLLKTTVVDLNDEKLATLTIGLNSRKMSDGSVPRSTARDSLSSFDSPPPSFDSRTTDSSTIGFDGNLDKSWEDNQQHLPPPTRESFSAFPRRTAPVPPHTRTRSIELTNPPLIPIATLHSPSPHAPPTTALPLTPPQSGSMYGSFPSPPSRQNRPSSAFTSPATTMEDYDLGVLSGAASTYSRASIRSLPVPLSARNSRSRKKGPPSMPPPFVDLPFLPPVPPSSVRPASADGTTLPRSASGRGVPPLPSLPPTGALPPPPTGSFPPPPIGALPPPPTGSLPPPPTGALPTIPIALSSRRVVKKPSRILLVGQ